MMMKKEQFEQTATSLARMNKTQLKQRIRNFKGRFRLDFSEEYLNNATTDRLRHILLAALISSKSRN